jgi:hypothetical protein
VNIHSRDITQLFYLRKWRRFLSTQA